MVWARCWALLLLGSAAACTTLRAEYPSWEPTPAFVPVVRDRKLALADLEASRQLWLGRHWQDYSYTRARQTSSAEVYFTLIVVHGGSVTERSLLASTVGVGANGLGDRMAGKRGRVPQVLWRERGAQLRAHATAAPALTVDQLYDLCRDRVLSVRSEPSPRLSFHRDGLLQHCGFLREDCADCEVVSIQTVGGATPKPWQAPSDLLCTDRFGLFLQGQAPVTSGGCETCNCIGTNLQDPQATQDLAQPGSSDICKLDPLACPTLASARANWSCPHLLDIDGCSNASTADPTPECMALPRPSSATDRDWQRRCLHEP